MERPVSFCAGWVKKTCFYSQPLVQSSSGGKLTMKNLFVNALDFAARKHALQKRKYTLEPYINHPIAVAKLVSTVPHDEAMLAAAVLHDTVEDTNATNEEIYELFGADVAGLVENLTDVSKPEDGNRAYRKGTLDYWHTSSASDRAKTVKLADLIDNSKSILDADPDFAKVYMAEKRALLVVLVGGDETLHKRATAIVEAYEAAMAAEEASHVAS